MIQGVNHITIAVADLERSFRFYAQVLGLKAIARWYKGAYLELGSDGACLTLEADAQGATGANSTATAFTVSPEDIPVVRDRLRASGAPCWHENHSEGDSLYFLDPDGHKLEIHGTPLRNRLRALLRKPPEDLVIFAEGSGR
jgi:catechol 2,3-dioxygenase-like lactoylglutathione lyase family enzyme